MWEEISPITNAVVCEVSWEGRTAVEQLKEMLEQGHQEKEERDYLGMDLIIFRGSVVFKEERKGTISVVIWPHRPSHTESQASKVVAHGRMQVFRR